MPEPIEQEFLSIMQDLAKALDQIFNGDDIRPKQNGFVLLTFKFDKLEGGRVNYISNADRGTMVIAMKEFIARTEGRVQETTTKQ